MATKKVTPKRRARPKRWPRLLHLGGLLIDFGKTGDASKITSNSVDLESMVGIGERLQAIARGKDAAELFGQDGAANRPAMGWYHTTLAWFYWNERQLGKNNKEAASITAKKLSGSAFEGIKVPTPDSITRLARTNQSAALRALEVQGKDTKKLRAQLKKKSKGQ